MEFSRPPGQRALEPGRSAGSAETDEGRTRRGKTREMVSDDILRTRCLSEPVRRHDPTTRAQRDGRSDM